MIPREVAWAFCGLELSSAWGPVWCLCGALRCGSFEMPLWRLTLWFLTLWFLRNVARNSLARISNIEITSLKFCGFLDTYEKLGYPNYVRLLFRRDPPAFWSSAVSGPCRDGQVQ